MEKRISVVLTSRRMGKTQESWGTTVNIAHSGKVVWVVKDEVVVMSRIGYEELIKGRMV